MVHFKRRSEPILKSPNNTSSNGATTSINSNISTNNNNNNNNNSTTNGSGGQSPLSRSTGLEKPQPPPIENKPKRPLSFSVFTLSPPGGNNATPTTTTTTTTTTATTTNTTSGGSGGGNLTPPMTPNKVHQSPNSSMSNISSPNSTSLPNTPLSISGLTNSTSTPQFKMPPKSNSVIYSVVYDKTSSNLEYIDDELFTRLGTQRLLLGRNKLTEIPERIGELKKLNTIDLSYNRLTHVPVSTSSLTDLANLILTGNKFMIPATPENLELQLKQQSQQQHTTNHNNNINNEKEDEEEAVEEEVKESIQVDEDQQQQQQQQQQVEEGKEVHDNHLKTIIEEDDKNEETKEEEEEEEEIKESKNISLPPLSIVDDNTVTTTTTTDTTINETNNIQICGGIPWELCYNNNLKKLDLGSNQSSNDNWEGGNILPSNLFWYTQIEMLLVPFCQLVQISKDIQHLESLTYLDISNNGLTELPGELSQLIYLSTLIANDNSIRSIPLELTTTSFTESIKTIDLSNNEIESIPNDFSYFIYLEQLNLSNNRIKSLPISLFQGIDENLGLFSIKSLKLRGNQIDELPSTFFTTLSNLKYLDLSYNNLKSIPSDGTNYLDQLSTFLIFNNQLESIPSQLFEYPPDQVVHDGDDDEGIKPNLTNLNLSGNRISELPLNIWKCKSLVNLSIGYNKIKEIQFPQSLVLYSLEEFYLNGNKSIKFISNGQSPDFPSLRELCLGSCDLIEIPSFCKDNLKSLEKFDLSNNKLTELPNWIGEFEHLLVFYLSRNQLKSLPYNEFKNLKNLIILDLAINNQLNLDPIIYTILKDTSIITSPSLSSSSSSSSSSLLDESTSQPIVKSNSSSVGIANNSGGDISPQTPKRLSNSNGSIGSGNVSTTTTNSSTNNNNKHEIIITKSKRFETSFSDMIGRRPTMEDSFSIFGDFNGEYDKSAEYDLISLFDGHAGSQAAIYSSEWFPKIMKSLMNKYPSLPPLQWLKQAYSEISLQFKMYINNEKPELKYCGATAASLLITRDFYCVSNIGDTRIVLCQSDGTAKRLSFDHKPSDPFETKRISKLGGFVVSNSHTSRVNGTLAVSRSIGDIYMEPFVVPDPYLSQTNRNLDQDKYLIVACDGIWDEITDEQACKIVLNSSSTEEACTKLKDYAYFSGSDDNITVIVIKLN